MCSAAAGGAAGPRSSTRRAAAAAGLTQVQEQQTTQWWRRFIPQQQPRPDEALEQIRQVNEAELEELLLAAESSGSPVVVTFSAHWCGPCKLLTKQLVATRADLRAAGGAGAGAEFVKVEAPEEEALSSRLGVHQLPCTFFVGAQGRGRPALRMEGLLAAAVIEEAITGKSAVLGSDLRRAIKL